MNTFNWLGMDLSHGIEIVAKKRLEELETSCSIQELPDCKEYRSQLNEFYHKFSEQLSNEQNEMLLEFDTLACYWSAAYGDSLFLQGFYEGMSFFRKMIETGLLKNERTKVTAAS